MRIYLSIIIPCYNEAKILPWTVNTLIHYLETEKWAEGKREWEIIIVNDGSTDETAEILKSLCQKANVRACEYSGNQGQGYALKTGFAHAAGEWILCIDADLDYSPAQIPAMLKAAINNSADIVVGSPYCKGGRAVNVPWTRKFMSRIMNLYFSFIYGFHLATYTSIFRVYRKGIFQNICPLSNDKDILPEIIFKARILGLRIVEIPANLIWNKERSKKREKGVAILATAAKAINHLLIGVIERPGLFILFPAIVSGLASVWLGVAILVLFFSRFLGSSSNDVLVAISDAFSSAYWSGPHTFLFFVVSLQTFLILFCVAIVVLQNKRKRDSDLRMFAEILKTHGNRTEIQKLS